ELDPARGRRQVARDDVEERRLPGAVRTEDRPPFAGDDLEVDVPDRVESAETPADPPQAEDRLGCPGGSDCFGCCFGHPFLMAPFTTGASLPPPGRRAFLHGGCDRPGGGDEREKRPPNDWLTFGMYCTVFTAVSPGLATIWYVHSPSTAWWLRSSFTTPNGVLRTTFASAACSGFWPFEMSPPICCRPFTSAQPAL